MKYKCKYCHTVMASTSQAHNHRCRKKEQVQSTAAAQHNQVYDPMSDFSVTSDPAPYSGGGGSFGGSGSSGSWDSGSSSDSGSSGGGD